MGRSVEQCVQQQPGGGERPWGEGEGVGGAGARKPGGYGRGSQTQGAGGYRGKYWSREKGPRGRYYAVVVLYRDAAIPEIRVVEISSEILLCNVLFRVSV